MLFTLATSGDGVALAANQVGIGVRAFIVGGAVPTPNGSLFLNPTVVSSSTERTVAFEGCLSLPGILLRVARNDRVTVSARRYTGEPFVQEFDGFSARVVQHEMEHLDGGLIVDHVSARERHRILGTLTA